jgi:hypothetical protein
MLNRGHRFELDDKIDVARFWVEPVARCRAKYPEPPYTAAFSNTGDLRDLLADDCVHRIPL